MNCWLYRFDVESSMSHPPKRFDVETEAEAVEWVEKMFPPCWHWELYNGSGLAENPKLIASYTEKRSPAQTELRPPNWRGEKSRQPL